MRDAWVKATDSGMTAAFGVLHNPTERDVRVVSARTPASARVELHETPSVDGQQRMRPKADGIVVPAGGTHELMPGGDHIMLMDVTRPVEPGGTIALTLVLDDGSTVRFDAIGKAFSGVREDYQSPDSDAMSMSPSS